MGVLLAWSEDAKIAPGGNMRDRMTIESEGAAGSTVAAPPVAIGGVGGSGTRLVAQLLQAIGYHIGDTLNGSVDTLWFTLLFKRRTILAAGDSEFDLCTRILVAGLSGGAPLDAAAIEYLLALPAADRPDSAELMQVCAESLVLAAQRPRRTTPWGWKEPNTHIVIERLWQRLPALRYIHVVRNGIDMAYSRNQNQLRLWGPSVLGDDSPVTPARSLAYWCKVHRRMQGLLAANPQRMYWLDYNAFCRDPDAGFGRLCAFLDRDPAPARQVLEQTEEPAPRTGIDFTALADDDIEYVRSLGYPAG